MSFEYAADCTPHCTPVQSACNPWQSHSHKLFLHRHLRVPPLLHAGSSMQTQVQSAAPPVAGPERDRLGGGDGPAAENAESP